MTGAGTPPPPGDERKGFSMEAMAPLLGDLSVDDVHRCHQRDLETARAVRLDPHSALRAATDAARTPDTRPPLGPGAIPGLRAAIHGLCPEIPTDTTALEPSQVAGVAARYAYARAVPFLLAAEHSAMLCDSEPPDPGFFDHAHLPYAAVSLWFARPVELLLTSTDFEITHLLSVAVAARSPETAGLDGPAVWHFLTDDHRIVVQADPSWTGHGWPSDILANALAAVVALPFRPPPPTPPELDATNAASRRAALRSTRVRRAIERGALTGVHVLDVPRLAPQSRVDPTTVADYLASRRSVRPHWRRGHWKRYRIARRGPTGEVIGDIHGESGVDWDYQLRWIAPMRVNATRDQPDTEPLVNIYRLRAPAGPTGSS
jgi:hypothetical protein